MNSAPEHLVILRLAVCVLGGPEGERWWSCDFLSESGRDISAYNFPRHPEVASYRATVLAAKRLHDERIGKAGTVHLFRLPSGLEAQVQGVVAKMPHLIKAADLFDPPKAMAYLQTKAEMEIDAPEGPVQVGLLEDCATPTAIAEIARHYHAAFRTGTRVYPYFATKGR
ncbi:MAG: hypothetical protein JWL59_4362 [Chthoniobacteraceae bacterium]|nr:hypothetical protein [Chthoniobacteraceae bacterium]